jgi:hypothetical protein
MLSEKKLFRPSVKTDKMSKIEWIYVCYCFGQNLRKMVCFCLETCRKFEGEVCPKSFRPKLRLINCGGPGRAVHLVVAVVVADPAGARVRTVGPRGTLFTEKKIISLFLLNWPCSRVTR